MYLTYHQSKCQRIKLFWYEITDVFWLHKSEYISHHTVLDQRFENNKYCNVLGEATLYDRFNIQAIVSHVSGTDNHERDRSMMAVRTAFVYDKEGFVTITVFS